MRITNSMMISNVLRDLNSGLGRTNTYYAQLASNRKMVKLSDNPVGLVNSLNARQEMRQLSQYRENITTTKKWTQQAETAITDMQSIIVSIKENVVDAGGTKNPTDRKNIASLVRELKAHLYESANTAIGDKFIFGGFNSTKKPFTEVDGKILYNGVDLTDTAPKTTSTFTELVNILPGSFKLTGVTNPPDEYKISRSGDYQLKVTNSAGVEKFIDISEAAVRTKIDLDKNGNPTGTFTHELDIGLNDLKVGTMTWQTRVTENALTKPATLNSLQWNGPIKAEAGNYGLYSDGADGVIISDISSNPPKDLGKEKIDPASGSLNLEKYGLGTVVWENNGATAKEIADAISTSTGGAGYIPTRYAAGALTVLVGGQGSATHPPREITVTSNLYQDKTNPVFKPNKLPDGITKWSASSQTRNKYNISIGDNSDKIKITDLMGNVLGQETIANNADKLDLTKYGLGEITFDTSTSKTGEDLAAMVVKTNSRPDGIASWDGPITAPNKYYLSVVNDRDGNPTNKIAIHDAQGTFIGEKEMPEITQADVDAGVTKELDLSEFGLGKIIFDNSEVKTGVQLAQSVANVGYVTTVIGEENAQKIQFEIGYKIKMDATFTGIDIMGEGEENMFKVIDDLLADLENENTDNDDYTVYLTRLTKVQDRLLTAAVELGARTQKLDTMENRYSLDNINMEARRTDIEDIDQAETIMKMKFAEAIYKQALATGAMIIQPTLMDFLN